MKTNLGNKGQSRMEYLMTYVWAIMVVMIVVVILWQMGILKVDRDVAVSFDCDCSTELCDTETCEYMEQIAIGGTELSKSLIVGDKDLPICVMHYMAHTADDSLMIGLVDNPSATSGVLHAIAIRTDNIPNLLAIIEKDIADNATLNFIWDHKLYPSDIEYSSKCIANCGYTYTKKMAEFAEFPDGRVFRKDKMPDNLANVELAEALLPLIDDQRYDSFMEEALINPLDELLVMVAGNPRTDLGALEILLNSEDEDVLSALLKNKRFAGDRCLSEKYMAKLPSWIELDVDCESHTYISEDGDEVIYYRHMEDYYADIDWITEDGLIKDEYGNARCTITNIHLLTLNLTWEVKENLIDSTGINRTYFSGWLGDAK